MKSVKKYLTMNKRRLFAVLLLLAVVCSTNVVNAQLQPLPVDEAVRIGKLDNGLTYYIRHNDYPEHRANFYIAQRVGSMQEEEHQRGLAHFLEHMAFNGSEHFKGNGIIDYTRTLGVAFGPDLNAGTGFNHTVYHVNNVPTARQSALDSCLLILKDWSHGLLLEDDEIDKERGVIHQEWRTRPYQKRMLENMLPAVYPDSKYANRMIIGLMDVIDNFPYQALRDYYHKWYRPDNQALVIVGDVDVDHTEAMIRELFKDIPVDPNSPKVEPFPVPDNEEGIYFVNSDKEMAQNQVELMFKHDIIDREMKNSVNYLFINYMMDAMSTMLNGRFMEKMQEEDCPYLGARCSDGPYLIANTKDALAFSIVPKQGETEQALQAVMTELLRARQYGFTNTEYVRAQEELMSQLEQRYNERDKISNNEYGVEYYTNFLDGEPIVSIENEYAIMSQMVPNVPFEVINQTLQQILASAVSDTDKNLVVVSYEADGEGAVHSTSESLKAAIDQARVTPIEAYVDDVKQEPLLAQLPKPGKITKKSVNTALGYTDLTLSNGARVMLKKTDFNQNEIKMFAIRRGGMSLYDEKDAASIKMMRAINSVVDLGGFNPSDISKALSGKQVGVSYTCDLYHDGLMGNSTVKDIETMFQLMYLNFTDMRKNESNFNKVMSQQGALLANLSSNLDAILFDSISNSVYNHDWRVRNMKIEDLPNVNLDRMVQIARESMANAADYTFIFTGSFDEETICPLIEQYVASLPSKKGKKSNWRNVANVSAGEVINHFDAKMETPKVQAYVVWHDETMPVSFETKVKAKILCDVLGKVYMQKIREDAGATYTVSTNYSAQMLGDTPMTVVEVLCPLKPDFTKQALDIINEEMLKACSNIDAGTINEIKEDLLKSYATHVKTNDYWTNVLLEYGTTGLDLYTGWEDIIRSQTPETISAFARQLLDGGNRVEVVMSPAE